jgi:uncharacterized protein (DUF58 family)
VIAGKPVLLMWASAVGAMAGTAMAWARVAWRAVEVVAKFTPARTFAGEAVTLRVRVRNHKRLPLPLVRLAVWLPPGLQPDQDAGFTAIRGYHRRLSLGGRSEAVIDLPVRVGRRGEFWVERIEVELSDPFDLVPLRSELDPEADLLVIPRPGISIAAVVARRLPFGRPVRAARMFEERERFAGVRPYEPGDPLSRIHWRLTGHAGALQTKLFEPTRSPDVILALDLSVGEPFWDSIYPDIAEDTIGWASFIARQAIEEGWRVGMIANTHLRRGRGPLRVPAGLPKGQEAAMFAALARMPNEPTSDLAPVLRETGRTLRPGTTAVVISPNPGPNLWEQMVTLRRRGLEVVHLSPLEARLSAGLGMGAT